MSQEKHTVMLIPSWLQAEITNTLNIRADTTQEKRIKTKQFIFEAISERLWRYKTYAYSIKTKKTSPPEDSVYPTGRLVDAPNDGGKSKSDKIIDILKINLEKDKSLMEKLAKI